MGLRWRHIRPSLHSESGSEAFRVALFLNRCPYLRRMCPRHNVHMSRMTPSTPSPLPPPLLPCLHVDISLHARCCYGMFVDILQLLFYARIICHHRSRCSLVSIFCPSSLTRCFLSWRLWCRGLTNRLTAQSSRDIGQAKPHHYHAPRKPTRGKERENIAERRTEREVRTRRRLETQPPYLTPRLTPHQQK